MKLQLWLIFSFNLFFFSNILAQQPVDCGLPSPPGSDDCEDACVYCDLTTNGYSGSTIGYTPDAPNNYCGTIENNQWFAFAAGTTTIEFTIIASNCDNGDGVQGAIYPSCAVNAPPIVCNGGANNGANNPIVVTANNLVVGQIYWFMVDGWLGDECDYDVTVTQGNTDPPPLDPPGPITGDVPCQGETVTFSVPPLTGASYYEWTLPDGSVITTQDPFVDYTFGAGGQICVQANNVCHFSDEVCMTVDVVAPAAGTITVNSPLCPNETANISVAGYNADPEFTQAIIVTDANGVIVSITNAGSTTFTHNACATFQVCSYNYVTAEGPVPMIGQNINALDCNANCCELICQNISFEDTEQPTFPNAPGNLTWSCFDLLPPMEDQQWTDNCDGIGMAPGIESGSANLCSGGSLIRRWNYTDACGNHGEHIQTITVDPAPLAAFDNPPGNMTVDCDNIPTSGPDLTFTNNASGDCLITGTASPIESGNGGVCGGSIIYTWEFTDQCNRTISHIQTITITPAPAPTFINPPADITLDCDNIPTSGPDLSYTNNASGACLFEGTVSPQQSGSADICGGVISFNWQFTDQCGNNINHTQTVTITPAPAPAFTSLPPDMTVDCDNIPTGAPDLSYTNNGPGNCLIQGTAPPQQQGTANACGGQIRYTWEFTDQCGNFVSYTQNITVQPAPPVVFLNPPADITLSCDNIPTSGPDLNYSNNSTGSCLFEGVVSPQQSGNANICGGVISYTWQFTDPCGNSINHTQNVTIDPAPAPFYLSPPADMTVSCDNIPTSGPDLNFTNNGPGACLIEGTVSPQQSGNANICGGTISYTWQHVDQCGNTLNHVQNITVTPAPAPDFINPPQDITVSCDNIPNGAPDLNYSNNSPGLCLIEGIVSPTQSGNGSICGGTIIYDWTFTDQCGNLVKHLQTITIQPAPAPTFVNPPPDMTVTCDNIPNGASPLQYTNNAQGACLIQGQVPPQQSGTANICGGTITYTWQFVDQCGNTLNHVQNITVEPAPPVAFVNPPQDMTISCESVNLNPQPLEFTNNGPGTCLISGSVQPSQSGSYNECGGNISYTWQYTSICGQMITHVQNITVTPAPVPAFIGNLPQDLTVSCDNVPSNPVTLEYTNNSSGNCLIAGTVLPVQSGSFDVCGGNLIFDWSFTDNCGNSISHQQTITVEPATMADFVNPPDPITINCNAVPPAPPFLNYSNNATGVCGINGTVPGIQSGFYDACGGDLIYTWVYTDECNRSISYSQSITVLPAPEPMFFITPEDVTVACGEEIPDPIDLVYTNNLQGLCNITGVVSATITEINDLETEYTWVYESPCDGSSFSHTQHLTETSPPDIFIDPLQTEICEGETFDLSSIYIEDFNNTNPSITFHSSLPAVPANQIPSSIVMPSTTTIYYILAMNQAGCFDEASFEILVEEPPFAGMNGSGSLCYTESNGINLFDYLLGNPDVDGEWEDTQNAGIDLSNPYNVNLAGFPEGVYIFDYVVYSTGLCPNSTASVEFELLPEIVVEVTQVACANDLEFYEVFINTSNIEIFVTAGTLNDLGNNQFSVTDIPISETLIINGSNSNHPECSLDVTISPPDCDCPTVNPPLNNGNQTICEGEPIPELSVSVGVDEIANWYNAPNGGTLLLAASTTYTPGVSTPGVYQYYVEAENVITGCKSLVRTPVQLTIFANPTGNDAILDACDEDGDGFVTFVLTQAQPQISSNPGYTYTFYGSQSDAESELNPLSVNFTNTITPTQDLYVVVTNQNGCTTIVQLTLTVYLPPTIDLETNPESCLNDANGSVIINSPEGVNYSIDGTNWTTGSSFPDLPSGTYTAYVEDENGCISTEEFTIDPGLELNMDAFEVLCDNNGTTSDPADDFYTINFTIGNTPGNVGTYNINDGTSNLGVFNYNESQTITDPAQGQTFTLTFTDEQTGCLITEPVGPLNTCSSECLISLDLLENSCSDNGTPADPSDDFYTVNINASAVNGGVNNTYNVLINNVVNYNFPYNTISSFTLAANGTSPEIAIVDNQNAGCLQSQIIGPLNTCSDDCILTAAVSNILCDDQGTGSNPDDDTYTFNLLVTGQNLSSGWQSTDGNYSGTYGQSQQFGPFLISDGDMELTITDNINQSCAILANAEAPLNCSFCGQTVDAGVGSVLNCNENTAMLEGSVSDPGTYIWTGPNNFEENDLMTTVSEPGWYFLTASFAGSCNAMDSVLIEQNNEFPTVDAGPDQTLSCDVLEIELQGSGSTANGTISHEWFNSFNQSVSSTQILSTSIAGTYTLVITDVTNGCSISDEVEIFENNEAPDAVANTPDVLTCEVELVTLDGSMSTGNGTLEYTWQDTGGNIIGTTPTIEVGTAGNYLLLVTDTDNNCNSSFPVTVLENIDTPFPEALALGELTCTNASVTLDGTGSTGNGPLTYQWLGPNSNVVGSMAQITVGTPGIYTLVITDTESTCTSQAQVQVLSDPETPIADATVSGILNCETGEVVLSGSASTGNGNLIYQWFDESDTSISMDIDINVSIPGGYTLLITDTGNGCSSEAFIEVEIDTLPPLAIILSPEEISCFNPEIILDASNSSGNSTSTIPWYDEDGNLVGNTETLPVDQNGTYSLTISNNGNACVVTEEVEVFGNADTPTADAGQATTLTCDVNSAILDASASTGSGALTYEWLNPSGTVISNSISTTVSQPGIYTVVVSFTNGCSDEATVEILAGVDIPAADAGPDGVLDCNVDQLSIGSSNSSTGLNISYQWFDEDNMLIGTSQFLDIDESGTYTLEVTNTDNNCQISDVVVISDDYNSPDVDPGSGGTLTCDITNIQLGGPGSSSGNDYTYEWQNSDEVIIGTDSTLDVSTAGIYTLYIFNTQNGCSSNASVEVFENMDTPVADPGINQEITCDNPSTLLDGSNSTGNNLTFEWFDSDDELISQNPNVPVSSSGTYTLVVTNSINGCTHEASVEVTTDDNIPQAVPIALDNLDCQVATITLDGSMSTSNSGDLEYEWLNDQGSSITTTVSTDVQNPGMYTLIVSDIENGCTHSMNVQVLQDLDPPVANAGQNQTLTCDIQQVTLSGSASNGTTFSFDWYDDDMVLVGSTQNINVSSTGIYELVVTNEGNGCTDSSFVEVVPDASIPTAFAGTGGTLTCDIFEITLDGTGSETGGTIEYQWQDADGIPLGTNLIITVTEPGVYTLIVTDTDNNCVSQDNVIVIENTDDPTAFIDQIGALDCNNQSLVLDGGGSSPVGSLDFEWSTSNGNIQSGGNTPNPEINQPGLYTLVVTDQSNGCTNTTSINIIENIEEPEVVIFDPDLLTCLVIEIVIDASASSTDGNFMYTWISNPPGGIVSGDSTLTPTVNQAGIYTLTILNQDNGCETTGFISVDEDVSAPTAVASVDDQLDCVTETVQLDGTGSSDGPGYTYLWTGQGIISAPTALQATINQGGTFTLLVTNLQNGCTASTDVFVDENSNVPQDLEVLVVPPLCHGDRGSIEVLEVQGGTPPYLYSLDGGLNFYSFTTFNFLNPGSYDILVQDANGCEYEESFFIPEVPLLIVDLGADIVIQLGTSTQLNAIVNIQPFLIDSIVWAPSEGLSCSNCLNPEVMPLDETLYQVTVTDLNGCTARDEIMLRVHKDRGVYIPNVFSPHNGDGINDGFMIFSGIEDVEKVNSFQVFDRWGELVFEDYDFQPNDPAHSWDGYLRGEPMNPAVFVYWARITFIDGVTLLYKGDVTLVR